MKSLEILEVDTYHEEPTASFNAAVLGVVSLVYFSL